MNIEIPEETIKVIQAFTGMKIEEFLNQTKQELLDKYQEGNIITIKEAARIMGKSEQFIRVGLQQNAFPFGVAFKLSTKYSYYISPKKFYEYVGYKSFEK